MWAWKYREPVCDAFEMLTGHRQNSALPMVGGVRRDVPEEYFPAVRKVLDELEGQVARLTGAVLDDPVLAARLKGVGVLSPASGARFRRGRADRPRLGASTPTCAATSRTRPTRSSTGR